MKVTFQQHLENMSMIEDVMTEAKQKLDESICENIFCRYRDYFPYDEEDHEFYNHIIMSTIRNRYQLMMERINNNKYHDILCDDLQHLFDEEKYFYKMIDYCTRAQPYLHDADICYDDDPHYVSTLKYNQRLRLLSKASYDRDHTLSIRWERVEEV